jgi:hypothetical protein
VPIPTNNGRSVHTWVMAQNCRSDAVRPLSLRTLQALLLRWVSISTRPTRTSGVDRPGERPSCYLP